MATTQPARARFSVHRPLPVRLLDKYFYFFMSLLIAATVIYGFSQTVNSNLFHPTVPRPTLLYFHAACFSGWVAFFIFQSALVRTHNVSVHRLAGWFGAALGAVMVVLGCCIAVIMARFDLHTLHEADVVPFLIVPLSDMTAFAPLLALAIYWRKKPEWHRRAMLMATCVLTSAAFGRFPMNFPPPAQFYFGVDALILLGVLRDLIVNRRIHKLYLYVLPILFGWECTTVYLFTHAPAFWVRISRAIIG
jgi:hypothetical protein